MEYLPRIVYSFLLQSFYTGPIIYNCQLIPFNRKTKMACPTILQTFILAAVVLDLNMAIPTTIPTTTPQPCGTCPVKCSSGPGIKKCTADCDDKGFSEVPNDCNYVANLKISSNSIHHIASTTFESFHQLELLKMKNNGIEDIERGSFAETSLGTIDLSYNRLQRLHKDAFLNLTTLTHVKVAYNHIDSIQKYNLPDLTLLDMSHNEIGEIHRSSFEMMTNMRHLYLSHNRIGQLNNNFLGEGMIHLITLDLSENNINSINLKAFYFLTNLETLDLSGNDITDMGFPHIPGALFESQRHLKLLSVSNNRISSLQKYMLEGLQKNLTEFSADNNQISAVESDIFKQLKFRNLTKLNLTNNKLESNFSKEFVPLLESQPPPKIELKGNPLCEEYQTVFRGQYKRYIFCSTKQMNKYLASEENTVTSELTPTQPYRAELKGEVKKQDILKLVCIISAGVLAVLLIILVVVWIKSQNRRTGNYTTCVTNRGYQYPSDRISEPETTPPPIPLREPLLDEAYANTTMSSYVTPNGNSSTNGHPPAINRHHSSTNGHSPSTNRHPPSSHRHHPSSHRHPPSSHRHSPSSNRHSPSSNTHSSSTNRHSFRRILNRLPSITHRHSSDKPIVVIGTITGTTGTTRIEGLPPCKPLHKNNTSHIHKKPKKSTAKSEEEGAYMIREETEDGKPKNATMASYRSVQD